MKRDRAYHREKAAEFLLDQRLALLDHEDGLASLGDLLEELLREWITGDLEGRIRAAIRIVLHQVVVCDTARHDTHRMVRAVRVKIIL